MKKQSVLICDSQFLSRAGLKSIIDKSPFYSIIGEASTLEELEAKLRINKCDTVTIDVSKDGPLGIDSLSLIQDVSPSTKIVVISNEKEKRHVFEVLGRGINHYITKNCRENEIYHALDAARNGDKYFCSKVLDIIISKTFRDTEEKPKELTSREEEIVKLIAEGKVTKEIAAQLFVSIHTIYTHRKNIMKKLKIKSPVELITYAINKGFVEF